MKFLEMKDKVSIITPCFNSAEYICDCIDSVVNQSYQNWEMIIIDDYSSSENNYNTLKTNRLDVISQEKES